MLTSVCKTFLPLFVCIVFGGLIILAEWSLDGLSDAVWLQGLIVHLALVNIVAILDTPMRGP